MDQIKEIATIIKNRSKAKDFKGTVKEVIGAWYGTILLIYKIVNPWED